MKLAWQSMKSQEEEKASHYFTMAIIII